MATAKQIAWRKRFARLYGRKKKRKAAKATKARASTRRRVTSTARRRKSAKPRRYGRRNSRGGISISLMSLAHAAVQYSNLTGQELGTVLSQLINSIMTGDDSFLDIVLGQVNAAIENVTTRPVQIAVKGAIIALVFSQLKKTIGSRKLIGVGKFSIRV